MFYLDLAKLELAFNENDLKLYYGFGDNGSTPPSASSIITVGGSGAFFTLGAAKIYRRNYVMYFHYNCNNVRTCTLYTVGNSYQFPLAPSRKCSFTCMNPMIFCIQ